ncbi:MAG: hypothetical protein JNK87_29750 [Bryobacterales bacterium]|nr:hypothetical protein [Bryobacterales bacterium]
MLDWTIIADDLTGAADCAAAFAQRGYSSIIWLHPNAAAEPCDVPVMETASRHVSPEEAYRRVYSVASKAKGHLFKKLDSTLHGNLGPEIKAVRDAAGGREVLIIPSHPVMGRTMKDGVLYLHGEPTSKHLPTILREQGLTEGYRVADCTAVQDLDQIVSDLLATPGRHVVAGAGALAEALALSVGGRVPRPAGDPQIAPKLVIIAGSNNPTTKAQLTHLKSTPAPPDILPLDRNDQSNRTLLATILPYDALLICGGDTARAVAKFLNAKGIRIQGEAARGVPYGTWVGGAAHGKPVATKAGGFGQPDTLIEAVHFLRRPV